MTVDTIFALSTAPGRAGLAVIRVSGPGAGPALDRLTGRARPAPRRAVRARLRDPQTSELIDHGLVLWFEALASATGEDVAEFHIHGGRAVTADLIEVLGKCPGLRLARPGEFARRAFENGKLDLTAAEGLADLIDADTKAQQKQALRQMQGELGRLYESWRARLLTALAHFEATIDFSDEEIPDDLERRVVGEITALQGEISRHLADGHRGERLRDGLHMAILGPPNAGKSSLLNLLAKRDAAIVSETAGTTRDVIEVHLDLAGYPLVVADTAGLRDSSDEVEREGVRRALKKAEASDLKLVVLDASQCLEPDPRTLEQMTGAALIVLNKCDLCDVGAPDPLPGFAAVPRVVMSVRTGEGVENLMAALEAALALRFESKGDDPLITRARHREALEECRSALARAAGAFSSGHEGPELAAEDLRLAARELGRITGRIDVEDLLDVIFRDFCIGK
ncbi:MAG: tRNA uridine-5-carboxymethylaminomethyl(34) synthesis GTPase MnmE [Rhodospirillales bacterium]|nr:tRNA uridine-5-carboxymethylaminomethyl(34) synthesis GTPase MnmE [Rhodospirillales bacterium]